MIKTELVDGHGSGAKIKVGSEGEVNVVVHPHPPFEETDTALPFRQRLTDDGTVNGSHDMAVNGSVNSVEFFLAANPNRDLYINSLSVNISDTGSPALNKFGALTALTNGVLWEWSSQTVGEITLHDGIKTNLEFIRTASKTGAIGTGTDAYLADVTGGGTEKSYLPTIDLSEQFGLPWGIRLRKGTTDRMSFFVRDNLIGLTTFDVIAYGIQF